jgi:tripartite-type tricarboxylate transporter receptor subunit TctC
VIFMGNGWCVGVSFPRLDAGHPQARFRRSDRAWPRRLAVEAKSFVGHAVCVYLLACASPAIAQTFPSKPIRMVVPFAPGGISDILARTVAEKLMEATGQPVVVDNRAGASGNIGTQMVMKAAPDGYTLLFCAPAFATNVSLYAHAGYDPVRDFTAVAQVASATNVVVATPATGIRSVKQLIDVARSQPGVLNYGSGGAGTSGQLAAELFQMTANIKITHVPYKGAGPALTALLGNEVQLMFSPVMLVLPQVTNGKLAPLAVTSARRSRVFPDVPTIDEAAIHGFDVTSWFGIVAPIGTPKARIDVLHEHILRALRIPDVADRLMRQGAEPVIRTADDFGAYIRSEVDTWARVIKSAGIKNQ